MSIKSLFPIFKNNPGLVYLDNSATTQKPQVVLDSLLDFYAKFNANVHRGLYPLSEKSTEMYEEVRKKIAGFINAEPEEIIFTSGTTDSLNLVAQSLVDSKIINPSSKILTTELEHHSNILPWQKIVPGNLTYIPFNLEENSLYKVQEQENVFKNNEYSLVTAALVSNVTGGILNFKDLFEKTKKTNPKVITVLDCAQAAAHFKIDVKKLNVDFIALSGHKMFGPTGVGVLYGKKEILEKLEPYRRGGGMINVVNKQSATWADLPEKFEAGTPPIAEAVALGTAVEFIESIGFNELIKHEESLRSYLFNKLKEIPEIKIFHPALSQEAVGVISFYIPQIHPHDVASYLGENNVCIRAGHHCTQILHTQVLKVPATCRVSLSIYNSHEDVDRFIEKLKEAVKVFNIPRTKGVRLNQVGL